MKQNIDDHRSSTKGVPLIMIKLFEPLIRKVGAIFIVTVPVVKIRSTLQNYRTQSLMINSDTLTIITELHMSFSYPSQY